MSEIFYTSVTALIVLQIAVFFSSEARAVADTTPPIIGITGSHLFFREVGSVYTDAGAAAWDNIDGEITTSIVTVNPVNTAIMGMYNITYDVADSAGNNAVQAKRIVLVGDNFAPSVPVASPAAGSYNESQLVSLSSTDSGSGLDKIYYTTDGITIPDRTSTEYVDPIGIDRDTTLKAIAYDKVGHHSGIMEAKYVITLNTSENSDDDDDDNDDKDHKKSKKSSKQTPVGTTGGGGATFIGEETEIGSEASGQVEGEEANLAQNNSGQSEEVAGEEVGNNTTGKNLIWRWVGGLLILLGLAVGFWMWKKKKT